MKCLCVEQEIKVIISYIRITKITNIKYIRVKIFSFFIILFPFLLRAQAPINDNCINAIELTMNDSYSFDNTYKGSIENADSEKHNQDVFFKFVANSPLITFIQLHSEFDADVYVYNGCSGNLVKHVWQTSANETEILSLFFTKGETYYIVVANFDKEQTLTPKFEIGIYSESTFSQETNVIELDSTRESIKEEAFNVFLPKFKAIDYDKDGDLDLFTGVSMLINDRGNFTEQVISIKQSFPVIGFDGANFFKLINKQYEVLNIEDVNKDGNVDLFLWKLGDNHIEVYSNVNKENRNWFYETPMRIKAKSIKKFSLFDYDFDGYKDYVIGNDVGFKIYQNAISFRSDPIILYEYNYSGLAKEAGTSDLVIADFNNDGLMDIFNGTSFFYRTTNGFKEEYQLKYNDDFFSIKNTTITYNNENIIEISGEIEYNKQAIPHKGVTIIQNQLEFHDFYSIDYLDYNNDGKLEKIVSDGDGVFYDVKSSDKILYAPLSVDFSQSLVKYVGDINKDGSSEVFIHNKKRENGGVLFKPSFRIGSVNTPPQAPTELNYTIDNNQIRFTWNEGVDKETPSDLLEYNLVLFSKNTTQLLADEYGIISDELTDSLIQLSNVSTLYGTILSSDMDSTGTFLVQNKQLTNMGTKNSFELEPTTEFHSLEAHIFAVDNSGLVSSNFTKVSIDHTYKLFSVQEDSLVDFTEYPQIQLVDFNADKKWDVSINERLYGNNNSSKGGKAYWYSQTDTTIHVLPQTDALYSNFISDFADFNNDGKIDLLNINNAKDVTSIYLNDSATFLKLHEQKLTQEYNQSNYSVTYQNAIFADYDSDGDLDCIVPDHDQLPHNDPNDKIRFLENNKGDVVSTKEIDLNILYFFDYDQNGEKDAICLNHKNGTTYLELWTRKGTDFTFKQKLIELSNSSLNNPYFKFESFDIDANGTFELIFHEVDLPRTTIFRQNDFGNYIVQLSKERIILLDYDNDGLVDYFDFSNNIQLFKNYGNWNFSGSSSVIFDFIKLLADESSITNSLLKTVDQDNIIKINGESIDFDGDSIVDILFSTNKGFNFYKNNALSKNSAPSIPTNLSSFAFEDTVGLTWEKSVDPNNLTSGLSYNVQVWNKKTGQSITPIHSQEDGSLLVPNKYTTNTNKYILRNLPDGEYEWKVQAIDQTHLPSAFSEIGSFIVNLVPEITIQADTVCNYTTSTIVFDPPSEHYQWSVEEGEIIENSTNNIKVKWEKKGNNRITLTNTKFNLTTKDSVLVLSNPVPMIQIEHLVSSNPLEITLSTDSTLLDSASWLIQDVNYHSPKITHTFSTHGIYQISVNNTYENKCTNNSTQSIDIFNPKIIGKSTVCRGDTITYKVEPIGYTYTWDIKGGTVIKEYNDSVQVAWNIVSNTLEQYIKVENVQLNLTNSKIIQVNESPTAFFEYPKNIGINAWINFNNTSINADSYFWDFDEIDNTSTDVHPTIMFNNIGQHTIILNAFTTKGCQNSYEKFISVSDNIAPILISNFLTPNEDSKNDILVVSNIERYPNNTVILYNAWGQEVFKQEAYDNSWNLKVDGQYISAGQYLCKVKINEFDQVFEQIITILK